MSQTTASPTTASPSHARDLESLGLAAGSVAFIVAGILSVLVFQLDDAPISGEGSVGQFAAITSAVTAAIVFVAGRIILGVREGSRRLRVVDVIDIAALAFAHAVIALLSWTLIAVIMQDAFLDAQVYTIFVIVLPAAAAAVTAYLVFASATNLDLLLLAVILAGFLIEGVVASMLTASDPHWWKDNLSALGMTNDLSAMTFNLTLIVAGVIVTTLSRYTTAQIPSPHVRGLRLVRLCLILVGLFLACVGIFPVDQFFWVHTGFASGMAVVFGVLVMRLAHWIPGMPRPFIALGWLFIAVIVVLAIFFAVGYYTLTAVELVAGVLVFSWIILFIRNAAALQSDTTSS
ncbi:hypothetical protein GCM10009808_19950 [Microbacterium sediminicola]|uniref:DUF998 domain-containing protein n=1 Tax=Microbacterium sediminicola TaxID=415210 RepID=A0ABP4UCQ5_9MICO